MKIISPKKEYLYELERLTALFFQGEKNVFAEDFGEKEKSGNYLYGDADLISDEIKITAELNYNGFHKIVNEVLSKDELKYADIELILAGFVYDILNEYTGRRPLWGVLTGVRPVKLIGKAINEGMDNKSLKTAFVEKRKLSEEKFNLAYKTYFNEKAITDKSTDDSFSLYVGIPFCPSRCSYCSFVSQTVEKSGDIIPAYLEKLMEEVAYTGKVAHEIGLKLRTVYIGGGTPTILTAQQIKKLTDVINANFDMDKAWEYTIEAGRPDTITEEKLIAIKNSGADRISINPQTLNDDVLKAIGRKHSAEDTLDKIRLARRLGFDNINTDIIAGLPTEDLESFKHTVDGLLEISPENITVHTLAVKRSANLNKENEIDYSNKTDMVTKMVDYAQKRILEAGYEPYYLYRQKNMLGNLENTGFCKKGFDGLYNVYIMDETHTILACGAGSTTKVKLGDKLERIANFKFPYEYINNFDEILNRKARVKELYEKYNI